MLRLWWLIYYHHSQYKCEHEPKHIDAHKHQIAHWLDVMVMLVVNLLLKYTVKTTNELCEEKTVTHRVYKQIDKTNNK